MLIGIVRTIGLGELSLVQAIDFGDCLLIGIVQTIDFGDHVIIAVV